MHIFCARASNTFKHCNLDISHRKTWRISLKRYFDLRFNGMRYVFLRQISRLQCLKVFEARAQKMCICVHYLTYVRSKYTKTSKESNNGSGTRPFVIKTHSRFPGLFSNRKISYTKFFWFQLNKTSTILIQTKKLLGNFFRRVNFHNKQFLAKDCFMDSICIYILL